MRRYNSLVRSGKIFKKGVKICSVRRTVAEAQDYCSRRKKDFKPHNIEVRRFEILETCYRSCLLYTSDAADERSSVDLGGRRIIKKKKKKNFFFFFKQKTAYEMLRSLVGSEMCIRDSHITSKLGDSRFSRRVIG